MRSRDSHLLDSTSLETRISLKSLVTPKKSKWSRGISLKCSLESHPLNSRRKETRSTVCFQEKESTSLGQSLSLSLKIRQFMFGFKRSSKPCRFPLLINCSSRSKRCQPSTSRTIKKTSSNGLRNTQLRLIFFRFKFSGPTKSRTALKLHQVLTHYCTLKKGLIIFLSYSLIEFSKISRRTSDRSMSS